MRKNLPENLDSLIFDEEEGFLFVNSIFDTFTVDEKKKEECLKKDEKDILNTLVREVSQLKEAYSNSMWSIPLKNSAELVSAVERRMVRPLLARAGTNELQVEEIPQLLGFNESSPYVISLEKVQKGAFEYNYLSSFFCKEARDIPVVLKVFTGGDIPDIAYGPSYSKLSKKWQCMVGWFKSNPGRRCYTQTISRAIAQFMVLNELDKKLHEVVSLSEGEKQDNLIYAKMKAYERNILTYRVGIVKNFQYCIYSEHPHAKEISAVLDEYGLEFSYVDNPQKANIELSDVAFSAVEMNPRLSMKDIISFRESSDGQYRLLGEWEITRAFGFVTELKKWITNQASSVMEVIKDFDNSKKEYSKSYETKKNISIKYENAMANSRLNEVFGFVEYDCSVDLENAREYSEEVCAFKERFLSRFDFKNKSIRLRKLGKHHAIGLYYAGLACLCVDVRHPEATVHEMGHMLDYGNLKSPLSMRPAFYDVKELYSLLVKKAVRKSNRVFKGKYNLNYYLQGTEVFARCFELYVTDVLKLKSSICERELNGEEYPKDEKLLSLIKNYFDTLLGIESETAA